MIKTKRWNDPAEPDDGFRLLVCRYRPRAVPKADETWDAWDSKLGPSRELHAAWYGKRGKPPTFAEYSRRYLNERKAQSEQIGERGRRVAARDAITLICWSGCTNPWQYHRTSLKPLSEEHH